MRAITLHDSLTGSAKPLEPREPGRVGIYACGPTVYAPIHVGNARPFVTFALLKRFLEHCGHQVTLVVNITDVNDKIYDAARAAGIESTSLAQAMTDRYLLDTDRLGLGRPDSEPRATDSIEAIITLIEELIEGRHAYVVDGDILFRVRSFEGYGSLSNRALEDMVQTEGDEVRMSAKETPQDFALWKTRKPDEDTAWPSPWGAGRPGWHIECSAMAEQALGADFEIHGGGVDLVFPHHENEIAQSEAARGGRFARLWMHNGMVRLGEEKMSKSVGNIQLLADALDEHGRDAIVMWLISGHYRSPIAYSAETVSNAARSVRRIRDFARGLDLAEPEPAESFAPFRERFLDALADDFNTAGARAVLFDWVAEGNRRLDAGEQIGAAGLREMLWLLGLERVVDRSESVPAEVSRLANEREAARAARDFDAADGKRDELAALGWAVRDTPEGATLVPLADA